MTEKEDFDPQKIVWEVDLDERTKVISKDSNCNAGFDYKDAVQSVQYWTEDFKRQDWAKQEDFDQTLRCVGRGLRREMKEEDTGWKYEDLDWKEGFDKKMTWLKKALKIEAGMDEGQDLDQTECFR